MSNIARTAWPFTAAAVAVLLALSLWVGPAPTSDAYISFQYANNFDAGHGLAANAGEAPNEGYDNLLSVLASAVLLRVGMDPPAVAPFLSLLFGAACIVTISSLLRRRAKRPAEWVIPIFLLATSGPFVVASMSLSGLTVFAFLMLLTAWSLERIESRGTTMPGVILVLSVTLLVASRLEGLVIAAAAAGFLLATSRSGKVTRAYGVIVVAAIAFLTLAFHTWRVSHFGRFVPDSLLLGAGFNRGVFAPSQPFDFAPFGCYYAALALITTVVWVRGRQGAGTCDRFALTVAGILGVFYLFVSDAVPGLGHHSALIGLVLVTWPAVVRLVLPETPDAGGWSRGSTGRVALAGAILFILVGVVSELRLNVKQMNESSSQSDIAVGRWLSDWRSGLSIATDAPGALTYYARANTLDLRAGSRIGGTEADRSSALARWRPDVIGFTANGMFKPEPLIVEMPQFAPLLTHYRLLGAVRTSWTYDRVQLIYVRKDIPSLTDSQLDNFPAGVGPALRLNR